MSKQVLDSITVTPEAITYLAELLAKQNVEGMGVRVSVSQGGTPQAQTCFAYCRPGEEQEADIKLPFDGFIMHLDQPSLPYLKEASVDYDSDELGGGQLTIKAPNAKRFLIDENSSVSDKVTYFLVNEVNPSLAAHGGMVQLIEMIEDDSVAILQFGGGCQGCGMVDVTLKDGVEKTLLERIPELKGVKDMTDHSVTENAFYK